MTGHSCTINPVSFLEKATEARDIKKPMDAAYLAFRKPLDKIPHPRLIRKTRAKNISVEKETGLKTGLLDGNS
jgi:hypothetical protein